MLDKHLSPKDTAFIIYLLLSLIAITAILLISLAPNQSYTTAASRFDQEADNLISALEANPDTEYVRETAADFETVIPDFDNSRILSCPLNSGDTFTVGIAGTELSDQLYIRPEVIPAVGNQNHSFAVYAECDSNGLVYPEEEQSTCLEAGKTYILLARTYEHLGAPDGLVWTHGNVVPGSTFDSVLLKFRIVDLSLSAIIGVCICDISWDGDAFSLAELRSTDIRVTEEYSESQREIFIRTAVEFMIDTEHGILRNVLSADDIASAVSKAVVHHTESPYFDISIDKEGKYIRRETISFIHPIAVSYPSPVGPVTVYLADCQEYTDTQEAGPDTGSIFYAFAYDILCPMNESSLILPPTLQSVSDRLQLSDMYR